MKKTNHTFRVCYKLSGSDVIEWAKAIRIEGRVKNPVIRFDDGNWCQASDCFFTEAQCRQYHRIPPKDWDKKMNAAADKLEKIAEAFRK